MNPCRYRFPDCLCKGSDRTVTFAYRARPQGETDFGIPEGAYDRKVLRCTDCGHYVSVMSPDMESALALGYQEAYVDATYRDEAGMLATYERIMALPPERSDNHGRVEHVAGLLEEAFPGMDPDDVAVLDVGSGLCVFPAAMRGRGYRVTALDPDPRAAAHAEQNAGVSALCGDFMNCGLDRRFRLVSLNKVLEHLKDPCSFLARAHDCLVPGGLVYIELPDGEAAEAEGPEREEFFIEHHHVFSPRSAELLASAAGFRVRGQERLREPSGKFTLRLLVEPETVMG